MLAPAPDAWVAAGRVARAHGVHGALRLAVDAEPECLAALQRLRLRRGERTLGTYAIAALRPIHRAVLVELEGVASREAAAALAGATVEVPRDDVPPPSPGEFYYFELVGLAVIGPTGHIGRAEAVYDNAGQPLLAIAPAAGGEPLLLPLVAGTVVRVARAERAVHVEVPPGLWDT